MLPRLLSPQFGLFDDGRSLTTAQKITHGVWDMSVDDFDGRFRPLYWLFFALPYALFGDKPLGFFALNLVVFALTTAGTMGLVRLIGGSRLQAWASAMLFAFSGPVIENYYTLSKGEGLQLGMLCASLLLVILAGSEHRKPSPNRWLQVILILLTAGAVLLANLSKETSLVVLPISAAWLIGGWVWRKLTHDQRDLVTEAAYFAASLLGSLAFVAWRAVVVGKSLTVGSYVNNYEFSVARIVGSASWWRHWWVKDFAYLAPLLLFLLIGLIAKKHPAQGRLLLYAAIWCGGWAVVFFPWIFTVEYYMLALGWGVALIGGSLIEFLDPFLSREPEVGQAGSAGQFGSLPPDFSRDDPECLDQRANSALGRCC